MLQYFIFSLAALTLCFSSSTGMAAPKHISLPPETAQLKKSGHPGYQVALQKCTICHSADYISLQPPGMSLRQWTDEVSKMKHAFGAPISDDEVSLIGEYLAVTYGNEKIGIPVFPAHAEKTGAPGARVVDARALLTQNGCFGCHAVDRKVVGPAFRDVAERYRKNPQAIETVMKNIKAGGSGKWGSIPMPSFAALSDSDIKALAVFVLEQ